MIVIIGRINCFTNTRLMQRGICFSDSCRFRRVPEYFAVQVEKVDHFGPGCQRPRHRIEQVERGDGPDGGEDRVDPDHAEHARAKHDDDRRHNTAAKAREAAMVQSIKAEMA